MIPYKWDMVFNKLLNNFSSPRAQWGALFALAVAITVPTSWAETPATSLAVVAPQQIPTPGLVRLAGSAPEIDPIASVTDVPRVLSERDVIRYQRVFELQDEADWAGAEAIMAEVDDTLLRGHVLIQRYVHPTAYQSDYEELATWLNDHRDLPGADRVRDLAIKRRPAPANDQNPAEPSDDAAQDDKLVNENSLNSLEDGFRPTLPLPKKSLDAKQRSTLKKHVQELRKLIGDGRPTKALSVLKRPGMSESMDDAEFDALTVLIARSYYAYGKDQKAFAMASAAAERSGAVVPGAHWTAGLAAWRVGEMAAAARHFEALAEAEIDDDYLVAGGAYWAARVHGAAKRPAEVNRLLRIAADYPRTIYGLLAAKALGEKPRFDWNGDRPNGADVTRLLQHDAVRRALALVEIGRPEIAERELLQIMPRISERQGRALLALVDRLDLPGSGGQGTAKLAKIDGRPMDAALYPIPDWAKKTEFAIDRSLVLAIVHQESGFNSDAKSHRGALGLMQIMPSTASYIDQDADYSGDRADKLRSPAVNLRLGQKYLRHLLDDPVIDGNLVFLLAAYNAGPGMLREWLTQVDHRSDPLLFIESLPMAETRQFVRRVLTNLWIYRDRLGEDARSLEAMATGRWPVYAVTADAPTNLAANGGN